MDLVYPNETRLFPIALALATLFWIILILGTLGIALFYIGVIAIFAIFAHSGFITHLKGNGIRITAHQFPDLHAALVQSCEKLGVDEIPEAYLLRTDFFNALATRFLRRHYIVLFTDVVDALEDRPGAINFYIGHELGHIHRKHIRWGWILAPVLWLPMLGTAYRRAEEYTCDRYGNACCESEGDAVAALAAIVAGDTRWKTMATQAYLDQVSDTGGFFMSFNEFVADYPWLCKRMAWVVALRNNTTPTFPKRNVGAGFLSLFVPSVPGGLVSVILLVAVIGILAAVAIPAYNSYIETAELATELATTEPQQVASVSPLATPDNLQLALQDVTPLRAEVLTYFQTNGELPSDLTDIGYEHSAAYLSSVALTFALYSGGVIAVVAGTSDEDEIYFVIEPVATDSGGLDWYCYGQNLPEDRLPPICSGEDPLPVPMPMPMP